jgi:hypothetical protein
MCLQIQFQQTLAVQEIGTIENVPNASAEASVESLFGCSSSFASIPPYFAQLQNTIDLVNEYLIQVKDADIPFKPYLTKKQKKQLSKLISYNIRSNGG